MSNLKEVVDAPLKGRIKTLESQVAELKDKLSNAKSQVDLDKVHLQAKVTSLVGQVTKYAKAEGQIKEYMADILVAVQALDPLPKVQWRKPKVSKTPMTAVLHLTDWHIGEVINPKEVEHINRFDWQTAQDRVLGQLLPRFKAWLDTQRSGYDIPKIMVVATGDFVSGDIHDELLRTNEFPLPEQTAKAGDLLGKAILELVPHCAELEVVEIGADNHSRLVRKPQAKQKYANSMSKLVFHIANQVLSRSGAVITEAEGMKLLFDINGIPFLGEHGDTVKSWMGVPWYGMEREVAREATRRMFNNRGFKHIILGHWHVPFFGKYIVGGSLSGTSEYDHSCGRQSSAAQTAFLVGKRGAFGFVPFDDLR